MWQRVTHILSVLWRTCASLILLGLFIYFLRSQRDELKQLPKIWEQMSYGGVFIGLSIFCGMLVLQSLQWHAALRALGVHIPVKVVPSVVLRRFVLGTFLPVGFTVAQFAFTQEFHRFKVVTERNHFASVISLLWGLVGYVILLVPAVGLLWWSNTLPNSIWWASVVVVCCVIAAITEFRRFFWRKGMMFATVRRIFPETAEFMAEWSRSQIDWVAFRQSGVFALGNHVAGIVLWLIPLLAFGVSDALVVAFLAYVLTLLVLFVSPMFQGIGLVELSLVYVLTQFGLSSEQAFAATLFFRTFQLWLPLLLGTFLIARHMVRERSVHIALQ